ncbi:hypothetical protein BC828DRAFT_417890 [Blastocladiella britannica]|nr:hypothetical protein BC828DRAFT_417890 [Blastocladiella britannica]
MNISLVLDRILLFAMYRAYTLANGLDLLNVSMRADIPTTYRSFVNRLVPRQKLGELGRVDLFQLLEQPYWISAFCPKSQTMFMPTHMSFMATSIVRTVARTAAQRAHIHILQWCKVQDNSELSASLGALMATASHHGQPRSIEWLRAYAVERGISYDIHSWTANWYDSVSSAQHIAVLDWWKADHAARSLVLFPPSLPFPIDMAKYSDDGLLLVEWWRAYCAETGRTFSWPLLDRSTLSSVAEYGSASLCRWWWGDTVQRIGIDRASERLTEDLLDIMCDRDCSAFLDWYWDLCADPSTSLAFPPNWRPRHPFSRIGVIQWFEAKVASGKVNAAVFEIAPPKAPGAPQLDALFATTSTIELESLDWYWARRDQYNLDARLSPLTLSKLVGNQRTDQLQWYLDHCTLTSPFPVLPLQSVANLVSLGHANLVEQHWQLLTLASPESPPLLPPLQQMNGIETIGFLDVVTAPVVLDYMWEYCARAGVSSSIFTEHASVNSSLKNDLTEAAKWWYAMHRVHGTAFPSAEELNLMKVVLSHEMRDWIESLQIF